ncbi:MAG: hypothetical protein GY786_23760 [Proteobacteria bacterium]|nr:hypothetical protein [Pseudomonadota bacterium]
MVKKNCSAVFDIGKTNVKLSLFTSEGELLHNVNQANSVQQEGPFPHCDTEKIWSWLLDSLSKLAKEFEIVDLVTVTHGATGALIDAAGELVFPVMDYEFEIPQEFNDEYEKLRPSFKETFSPSVPVGLNFGRQIYWLQNEYPHEFARVSDILMYPQYWSFRLSGKRTNEVTSLGCHTDLWNPLNGCYSTLVSGMKWDSLFPAVTPTQDVLGVLKPELANQLGFSADCKIINGIHDSNASYFRHRKNRQGAFSVVSTGTWVICMAADQDIKTLDESLDTLANVDAYGEPVACSRFMGGREFEILAGEEGTSKKILEKDIESIIHSSASALPGFSKQGGPFSKISGELRGEVHKFPKEALATLYCALMTDTCLDLIHAEGDLIIEGSFIKNSIYCRLLASLRPNQPVFISEDKTGTAQGALELIGKAAPDTQKREKILPFSFQKQLVEYQKSWRNICWQKAGITQSNETLIGEDHGKSSF